MAGELLIHEVDIELSDDVAVRNVSLSLDRGTIGCLMGPSGCGKTTLLRSIAGFADLSHGHIEIDQKIVADVNQALPTEKRQVGMVFQDYALFPHLNLRDNLKFGLQGVKAKDANARIDELVRRVDLTGLLDRYPHELSGGQQQRAALARALAPRPKVLLLDEPFSSQDAHHREQLAREVGQILRDEGVTALLVTHDQYEGFAMADMAGVMNQGRLLQWSNAYDLYHMPTDRFVAKFIGEGILVCGVVTDHNKLQTDFGELTGELSQPFKPGQIVDLLVRPDDILHDDDSPLKGEVVEKTFRGSEHLYQVKLPTNTRVFCVAPSHHDHYIGEKIGLTLALDHLVVFATDNA
ncbi:MAG: ABC transporter ATP-binding protein [Gammaproteobacteria bacterium]|nr:ABC transporter ATP-binding protein [Gammaproteobacteria bacterium]